MEKKNNNGKMNGQENGKSHGHRDYYHRRLILQFLHDLSIL